MTSNPLLHLKELGQSLWLDYVQRQLLSSGELARMIANDGLAGVTSNPSIFQQAIVGHDEYREDVAALIARGADVLEMYHGLITRDIVLAAEVLRPVYEASCARDGYVSIEVSPHLAYDAEGSIVEGRKLWAHLARPNVMIKVPATRAGLHAIQALVAEGVNVNVTLLFGIARYREVLDAWMQGLEQRLAADLPIHRCASVASFFVSRIDTLVDQQLDRVGHTLPEHKADSLRGQAAIASARLAYQVWRQTMSAPRWRTLAAQGAMPQRLLWASTGTKDPAYSDVKYVEALIGPDTVNTLPPQTLAAYRQHGQPALRLETGLDMAQAMPMALGELGIDLEGAAAQLEEEGVQKFIDAYDGLLATLGQWRARKRE
jgi:transaldolase